MMRIPCPYCGERDVQRVRLSRRRREPVRRGVRDWTASIDYVYLRDNAQARMREHWYHAQGCRNWIVVTRDTRDPPDIERHVWLGRYTQP